MKHPFRIQESLWGHAALLLCAFSAEGCNKQSGLGPENAEASAQLQDVDDQSRCDTDRPDREVQESSAPGAVTPNVRRVYGLLGVTGSERRVLLCREVDTNFDGRKDLVRTYDDEGKKKTEQADTDYDGKMDTWIHFSGRWPAKVELDTTGDGEPNETKYYSEGTLLRITRDTNADGNPDIFEVYKDGQLLRMGVDVDFNGRVDRWLTDKVRDQEAAEKEAADSEDS